MYINLEYAHRYVELQVGGIAAKMGFLLIISWLLHWKTERLRAISSVLG
jgi:hypothetical protein